MNGSKMRLSLGYVGRLEGRSKDCYSASDGTTKTGVTQIGPVNYKFRNENNSNVELKC